MKSGLALDFGRSRILPSLLMLDSAKFSDRYCARPHSVAIVLEPQV